MRPVTMALRVLMMVLGSVQEVAVAVVMAVAVAVESVVGRLERRRARVHSQPLPFRERGALEVELLPLPQVREVGAARPAVDVTRRHHLPRNQHLTLHLCSKLTITLSL